MATTSDTWQRAKGHRRYRAGDQLYVQLPGYRKGRRVTFVRYVEPDRGAPYLEVRDQAQRLRCVAPAAFLRGA